jgi:NADPH:quinone reductase
VVAANPTVHDGSWAELVVLSPELSVAPKPASLEFAGAGVAPLAGITALAAIDALALSEGATVPIVGATGGAGSFAVQLAVRAGARVVASALTEDVDHLHGPSVAEVFDRAGDVVALVRESLPDGAEAPLDLVSYAPGAFAGPLTDGGRVAPSNGAAGDSGALPVRIGDTSRSIARPTHSKRSPSSTSVASSRSASSSAGASCRCTSSTRTALLPWGGDRVIKLGAAVAPQLWRRYPDFLIDGLQADVATPLQQTPLTRAQLRHVGRETHRR